MTIGTTAPETESRTLSMQLVARQVCTLEEQTAISSLTDLAAASIVHQRTTTANEKKHKLFLSDEWMNHSNFQDNTTWKRRKRGKCMFCSRNTVWFCTDCNPKPCARRAWVCDETRNSQCKEQHEKNIKDTANHENGTHH